MLHNESVWGPIGDVATLEKARSRYAFPFSPEVMEKLSKLDEPGEISAKDLLEKLTRDGVAILRDALRKNAKPVSDAEMKAAHDPLTFREGWVERDNAIRAKAAFNRTVSQSLNTAGLEKSVWR